MKAFAVLSLFLGAALATNDFQRTCEDKPDGGMCRGYFPMFYYDGETGTCKSFVYGGCQGNGNRYATEEECLSTCRGYTQKAEGIWSLPPVAGPCFGFFPSYYYDAASKQCKEMVYGGCKRKGNRFKTAEDCYDTCNPKIEGKLHASVDVCALQPETGPCKALIPRFYYDTKSGECKTFTYGGCGGNGNKFETKEECDSACNVYRYEEEKNCSDEPETGLCQAYFPRYYYDKASGECKEFIYGGCGGNGNNYKTEEACLDACR